MAWLVKLPWKPGRPAAPGDGGVWVAATRLRWKRALDLPSVSARALALRASWAKRPGALGISLGLEPRGPATWSLSAWTDQAAFQSFLDSSEHRALMTSYKPVLAESASAVWRTHNFVLAESWGEARRRLDRTR